MARAIGIDLGTTNSCVAVIEGKRPAVVPDQDGNHTTPSVVSFSTAGIRLVGTPAKRQAVAGPTRTISSIKRFMGRLFSEVGEEREIAPYEVIAGDAGDVRVQVGEDVFSPPEISAMILQKLKADAEAYLGEPVSDAVITVPAYFNNAQREATKDAGKVAGLNVIRIINEPTAAALAYGLGKDAGEQTVLVFDLGGGTFDVSVLEIDEGLYEVKSTAGDNHLGGDNFDKAIVDWMVEEFYAMHGIELNDPIAFQRLYEAAEKAKIELSSVEKSQISLPFLAVDDSGPKNFEIVLTRNRLNELTGDLIERTVAPVRQALADAHLDPSRIDEVILVGGMTRMPAIRAKVLELLGREPHAEVNPDEVVALGASVQAGILRGEIKDVLLLDVTPLSLGIEAKGGVFVKLIERNTTIPARRSEFFTTTKDSQDHVKIHVLQGESEMTLWNKSLGHFKLLGIPEAPRGIPQIEVAFDIDANGIINVSARDIVAGLATQIKIEGGSGLSQQEIEMMRKEAKAHADEARHLSRLVEAREQALLLLESSDLALTRHGYMLPEQQATLAEEAGRLLRQALETDELPLIEQRIEALSQATHRLVEALQTRSETASVAAVDFDSLDEEALVDDALVTAAPGFEVEEVSAEEVSEVPAASGSSTEAEAKVSAEAAEVEKE